MARQAPTGSDIPPVLDYPRQTDIFVLTTDASDICIGAVLTTAQGTVVNYTRNMPQLKGVPCHHLGGLQVAPPPGLGTFHPGNRPQAPVPVMAGVC